MTSELRPAVEVWRDAAYQYGGLSIEGGEGESLAAAVIEADREAVRAEMRDAVVATAKVVTSAMEELAKWKALAETLAGALEPFAAEWDKREFLAECHWSAYSGASQALTSYKEQRDA